MKIPYKYAGFHLPLFSCGRTNWGNNKILACLHEEVDTSDFKPFAEFNCRQDISLAGIFKVQPYHIYIHMCQMRPLIAS